MDLSQAHNFITSLGKARDVKKDVKKINRLNDFSLPSPRGGRMTRRATLPMASIVLIYLDG